MSASFFTHLALLGSLAACAAHAPTPQPDAATPAKQRELRVGASADYPPFSELRDGRFAGFSVALSEAYARSRSVQHRPVQFKWPELMADLAAARFELANSGITVRPERSIAARYTVPVARSGSVLLLRRPRWAKATREVAESAGDPLAMIRLLDRPAFRLAVNKGGHLERVAREHFLRAQITAVAGNAGVRSELAEGRADAALTNTIEAARWAEGLAGIEHIGPFTRDWVALLVRPDRAELAEDLDAWLLAHEQNGGLEQLRSMYLGLTGPAHATAQPVPALLAATAERLALMPMVAAAKRRLSIPVDDSRQEARVLSTAMDDVRAAALKANLRAPPQAGVRAFFEAQFQAAKTVQRTSIQSDSELSYALDEELRPALARISARIAWLLVRLPAGLDRQTIRDLARDDLATADLPKEQVVRIADTISALGPP